jgi:hypothetical protein
MTENEIKERAASDAALLREAASRYEWWIKEAKIRNQWNKVPWFKKHRQAKMLHTLRECAVNLDAAACADDDRWS